MGYSTIRWLGNQNAVWKGPVTGVKYSFTKDKPAAKVDRRDAECMVDKYLQADSKPWFEFVGKRPNANSRVSRR